MKTIHIVVAVLIASVLILFPLKSKATVPPLMSFGGFNPFSSPCTCTAGGIYWSYYAPLFLSSIPITGPLAYVSGASTLFANYIPPIDTETSDLGQYLPNVQVCYMGVAPYCYPMPNLGIEALLGTSLPGSK